MKLLDELDEKLLPKKENLNYVPGAELELESEDQWLQAVDQNQYADIVRADNEAPDQKMQDIEQGSQEFNQEEQ